MSSLHLRLGTRASLLATWQANWVAARLQELGFEVEQVLVTTSGDEQQTPVAAGGSVGIFTKEIERELLADRIDLAVHSLKDLPTDPVPGLTLAAVPQRAPVCDVLVSSRYSSFEELPQGASVGTGSLRRRAQLLHARPDLQMRDIRGNVDTRLRKLRQGEYDAIVLAEAGLRRLGFADQITQVLPLSLILPAIGQGALGIETRADDQPVRQAVAQLDHPETHAAVVAERAMLSALHGGCMAPIAAWGRVENAALTLSGRVLCSNGSGQVEATLIAACQEAESLGRRVAEALLAQGAAAWIEAARG
jgi:hydroxymethylbilane synthase